MARTRRIAACWCVTLIGCGGQIELTFEDGGATSILADGSAIIDGAALGADGGVGVTLDDAGSVAIAPSDAGLTCTSAASCAAGEICCASMVFGADAGRGMMGGPPGGGGTMRAACAKTCGGGGRGGGDQQLCAGDAECKKGERCRPGRDGQKVCR